MWRGSVLTDANGIVLFEPDRLRERYGGSIAPGTDLFASFVSTGEGDAMLAEGLVTADLAVFRYWEDETDWLDVPAPPGAYAVTIRGFQALDADGFIRSAGYDVVLDPRDRLPAPTADTGRDMRVLRLPTSGSPD